MTSPGFSAVVSIYSSPLHYATVFGSSWGSERQALPALPIRNGGGNGGGACPTCDLSCDSTCHRTCTACTGRTYRIPCCGPGYGCSNGTCICSPPKTPCGNVCADLSSDPSNCDQCGNACPTGSTCQLGGCYPTPPVCGPCTNGFIECCSFASPDQRECSLTPCCQRFNGPCTGAGGPDKCITAGGTAQCCHSNWLYGWYPWITVCGEFTATGTATQVTKGCNGPCW
jgi:hypothetical protein